MRKLAVTITTIVLATPAAALADPDFGPGNSSKGPNDAGAKCHTAEHGIAPSPNQDDVPGCKGN